MPRPRKAIPPTKIIVSLPNDLLASVDTIFWDPVLDKPKYGSRSALITMLLRQWVAENFVDGRLIKSPAEIMNAIKLAEEDSHDPVNA